MRKSIVAAIFAVTTLAGCPLANQVFCPNGGTAIPPSWAACAAGFLQAAGPIASCAQDPTVSGCISDVTQSVGSIAACTPTCSPAVANTAMAIRVSNSVLATNIRESLAKSPDLVANFKAQHGSANAGGIGASIPNAGSTGAGSANASSTDASIPNAGASVAP